MLTTDFETVAWWVAEQTDCSIPRAADGNAVGWLSDGEITCGVLYEHFTGKSITATIAVEPGAIVPPGFIRAIFDYPFKQLGCKKILAYVEEGNTASRNMVERMGFEKEAVIFDVFPDGAMIIYSVVPDRCRYLEKEHGKKDEDCAHA